VNKIADETEGILRISIDTKATINVGPFSRGGCNRYGLAGCDHDFQPESKLKLFGISIPALDENYFYFTESYATADFMMDALESLWPCIESRFNLHTVVINLDNGPENSSRRSQFMNRLVAFAKTKEVSISMAYYPPYHSKYNYIERVWGVLENHWRGEILHSIEKVLRLARTMKWNRKNPVVKLVQGVYEKGIKLTNKAMKQLELGIDRIPGLEKWALDIPCYQE
jgi:transposase